MGLWSLTQPPVYFNNCSATEAGWVDNVTGELLVALPGLVDRRLDALDADLSQFTLENGSGFIQMEETIQADGYKPQYLISE